MMNKYTLEKLKKNPHYKLSDAQKKELEDEERKPMVSFGRNVRTYGIIPKQTPTIDKHPVEIETVVHKK